MAEAVSAIAGLVVIGAKIGASLNEFISGVRDSPKAICSIRNELYAANAALCQIQASFGDPEARLPPKNVQRDIHKIIRSCQDTFEHLQAEVQYLKPDTWSRVVWLTKEKHVLEMLRRIDSHKSSLNLIITVMSENATARVENRLSRMGLLLGHIAKSQQKVSKRLRVLEKGEERIQESDTSPASRQIEHQDVPAGSCSSSRNEESSSWHPSASQTCEPIIHPFKMNAYYGLVASETPDRDDLSAATSEISDPSDMSINELDVHALLRSPSVYSLASFQYSQTSQNQTSEAGSTPLISLRDILSQRALPPYDLRAFCLYLRDSLHILDYLGCWFAIAAHRARCQYVVKMGKKNSLGTLTTISHENEIVAQVTNSPTVQGLREFASAERIMYTYLLPGSERGIILPETITADLIHAIEAEGQYDPKIFDVLEDHIFIALDRDAYPGFMKRRRALLHNLRVRGPLKLFDLKQKFQIIHEVQKEEDE